MPKQLTFLASIESHSFSDIHLFKDVALVPLMLGEALGYHVTFVCHNLNEQLLHTYFPTASFDSISLEHYDSELQDYIFTHGKDIDLVFAFGPYPSYLSILSAYKHANPWGKVYMKLDVNRYWLQRLLQFNYTKLLLSLCDFISSESRAIAATVSTTYGIPIYYMPNGYFSFFPAPTISFSEKENIILSVGRLGSTSKQTPILIEAFLKAHLPDWQLRLVGPIDDALKPLLNLYKQVDYFNDHVTFTGPISDKTLLEAEYAKAKIFCSTSNVECCAHVFAEAAKYGCYIISTDVDGVYDLTLQQRYSTITPVDDVTKIADAFLEVCANSTLLEESCTKFQAFARTSLSWNALITDLAASINSTCLSSD